MVGYISLEEQVDKDFSVARRKALLGRIGARLRRGDASDALLCFDEVRKFRGAMGRVYRGARTVPVGQIGGSVGRCSEFDRGFMPAKPSVEERWKRVDRVFHRGEELSPVSLYKVGDFYFVLDGHHRVSVASYHGVEWIDAYVTEFGTAGLWSDRRDRDGLIEPPKGGEPRMHEMMNLELAKQRHEEVLREAELSRQVKALRATRKRRTGFLRMSARSVPRDDTSPLRFVERSFRRMSIQEGQSRADLLPDDVRPARPRGGSGVVEAAIEVHDLVKTYPGDVRALDGLSFAVEPGTIFGLLGPNGAGKSTTIKILTTLARPSSGEARVAGRDVLREPDRVRRAIGCVSQRSGADLGATGRENLTLQGRIYGLGGRELGRRVPDLLERFGLTDAAARVVSTYSGGMQRRLDIAMGLVHRPKILFLDEPTAGLDPEARADMWKEISRMADEEGLTILLTSHYLEEADRLAKRLAIVDRGRIVAEGSPEQLKEELRGDAINVELAKPEKDERARGALDRLEDVREVVLEGQVLRARADSGATAVPTVLAALESRGVKVASVTIARPSLDDVYLRHAGRSFNKAEKEDA